MANNSAVSVVSRCLVLWQPLRDCRQQHGAWLWRGHCYCNISAVTQVAHDPAAAGSNIDIFRVGGGDPPISGGGRCYACVTMLRGVPGRALAGSVVAILGTAVMLCYITGNSFLLGIVLFSMREEAFLPVGSFLCRAATATNQLAARSVYQPSQPIIRFGARGQRPLADGLSRWAWPPARILRQRI